MTIRRPPRVGKGGRGYSCLTVADERRFRQWRDATGADAWHDGTAVYVSLPGEELPLHYRADDWTPADALRWAWKQRHATPHPAPDPVLFA